ncbi:MAG TPA: peroxidase family protein, partial [Actinoplanes sp.]|nr:peroxidase family protein [Actinoplanes sp.]
AVAASRYTTTQLNAFRAMGIVVTPAAGTVGLTIPLNVAFFNPDLVQSLGIGPFLSSLAESQYNNDSMIDNQLRSTLFQVPVTGNPDCLDGPTLPDCFTGVVDLGAIDIERSRDHGEPTYNQLRQAYGLAPKTSFTAITGESTESFPADAVLTRGDEINDPQSLDFLSTADINGTPTVVGDPDGSTSGVRRTPVAARLKAVYGDPNSVDGFVGMMAERHLPGSELGELQTAIWRRQFQALRDGDRFFYGNDQGLGTILSAYGVDFHTTLAQVIARNTDLPSADINPNVFLVPDDDLPAATCSVQLVETSAWTDRFQVNAIITNETNAPINGWTVRWQFPSGQTFVQSWNGTFAQQGTSASLTNASWNTVIPPGQAVPDVGFIASWDNKTNPMPANITLNNKRCAME